MIDAHHEAPRADRLVRQEAVDAGAAPQVQHRFAFPQIREPDGRAAPDAEVGVARHRAGPRRCTRWRSALGVEGSSRQPGSRRPRNPSPPTRARGHSRGARRLRAAIKSTAIATGTRAASMRVLALSRVARAGCRGAQDFEETRMRFWREI